MIKKIIYLSALAALALTLQNTKTKNIKELTINLERTPEYTVEFSNDSNFDIMVTCNKHKEIVHKGKSYIAHKEPIKAASNRICGNKAKKWEFLVSDKDGKFSKLVQFKTKNRCLNKDHHYHVFGNTPKNLRVEEDIFEWYV